MHQTLRRTSAVRIPPLIKRNTTLFALSQSFTGAGMQLAYGLGPLMVLALAGNADLAGLSVALLGISRFLVAYPTGRVMDRYGRKPGILMGLALALAGTISVGLAMRMETLAGLVIAMLLFGMGMSAAQQLRVAATDMYPPHYRATALGFIALGQLGGMVVNPILVSIAEKLAHSGFGRGLFGGGDMSALALPWLMLPLLIVPGMALVRLVRPDPKEIGMHLERYYPDYVPPAQRAGDAKRRPFSARRLLANVPIRFAVLCNAAGQGNMSIMMVLTSLVLHHHGHGLGAIAASHAFHSAGMFAFTIPLGRAADRLGRQKMMVAGVATTVFAAGLVSFTGAWWSITLGTFLVGLGWAAGNVSATASIADHAETAERGRAIGLNDSIAASMTVTAAVLTGPMIDLWGLPAAGLLAMCVALLPLAIVPSLMAHRRAARMLLTE
jgi:MFS family permease